MKKDVLNKIVFVVLLFSFVCVSCNNQLTIPVNPVYQSSSIIVKKIQIFKQKGLLDNFGLINDRSCVSDEELNNLVFFVEHTEDCIIEILEEENGKESLDVLNAIYEERSIGDVYDAMMLLSPTIADEFASSLIEISNSVTDFSSRSVDNFSSFRDIKINFGLNDLTEDRKVDLSKSYNWGCVAGYIGAAAAATAGFVMYKFGGFWTRIAGLAAGGVGVAAMATFIGVWQESADWMVFQNLCIAIYETTEIIKKLYQRLSEKEKVMLFLDELSHKLQRFLKTKPEASYQITPLLLYIDSNYTKFNNLNEAIKACIEVHNKNTDFIPKTVSVSVSTAAVYAVAYFTGFAALVNGWKKYIESLIPEWLTITIDTIEITIYFP